jgi:hypothetical protein
MSKKPNYFNQNYKKLVELCDSKGYLIEEIDCGSQYRVYGATHVIDIWPSRMVYHRISGEDIKSVEPYYHNLDWEFNKNRVVELLDSGELK